MLVDCWIDMHAHVYPPESKPIRSQRLDAVRKGCWCVDASPEWKVARTLAYMDRTGIQMQMFSNIPKGLEALRNSTIMPPRWCGNILRASVCSRRCRPTIRIPRLAEIAHADELEADAYTVTFHNGTCLGDRFAA